MKQEDKELFLKDLCARLPHGVIVSAQLDLSYDRCFETIEQHCSFKARLDRINCDGEDIGLLIYHDNEETSTYLNNEVQECPWIVENITPYLRPMSSMTEEEINEFILISDTVLSLGNKKSVCILSLEQMDWLNAHHFDYRGLIDKGLAIEVTDENNPYKLTEE